MKIAYLISAHTDAEQLRRLIGSLHEDAHYFIHIDKKSDLQMFKDKVAGENIHFLDERVDVRWGTWLEVVYQMLLLRAAVDCPVQFDRIFTLSGMDYPVWSNERITQYLESLGDKEVLQGICMDSDAIAEKQQVLYQCARPFFDYSFLNNTWNNRLSIICRRTLKLLGRRKRLFYYDENEHLVQLYKGSSWWCITEGLARYVLHEYDTNKLLKNFLADSFGQAETFVQTVAFNSEEFKGKCMLHNGEYPGLARLTPLHFIDYNPVIQILDERDYARVVASGKMFCRKIVSGQSDALVRKLDENR